MKNKVKIELHKIPNGLHFDVQKNNRVQIVKARKGKGSYTRKTKHKDIGNT